MGMGKLCNYWFLFSVIMFIPTVSLSILSLLTQGRLSQCLIGGASLYLLVSIWLLDFAVTRCEEKGMIDNEY